MVTLTCRDSVNPEVIQCVDRPVTVTLPLRFENINTVAFEVTYEILADGSIQVDEDTVRVGAGETLNVDHEVVMPNPRDFDTFWFFCNQTVDLSAVIIREVQVP